MKLSGSEQESIVQLLTRIYIDIRDMEERFSLLVGGHDFRPRIEYFHDAVRAFTSEDAKHRESGGRLSIELLAYDLNCLRYIESMPLSPFKPHATNLSPQSGLAKMEPGLAVKSARPDRVARERISELYQHYAVLFAALLKPFADADFHDRIDDLNQDVRDIHGVIDELQKAGEGKSIDALASAVQHLNEDELRNFLMTFLQQQKYKNKDAVKKLIQFLKQRSSGKDKEIAGIESAHMNYALAQLAVFEGSKDMLKKMAAQGMNLVGKFVEASLAQARREMGR